jgi:antitoxin ParD1/3/4
LVISGLRGFGSRSSILVGRQERSPKTQPFHIVKRWQQYLKKLHLIWFWCIFTPNNLVMARQSISLTKPNDDWLKNQVKNKEYSSKSELVNDLIRQARKQQVQIDWIRARLEKAENSGFTTDGKDQILNQAKSSLNG